MDDLISLIVVILIVVISSAGSKKNKEKKRQKKLERQMRRAEASRPAQAASAGPDAAQTSAKKPEIRAEQAQSATRLEADCAKRLLHLHEVSQQVMEAAGEGEDPCHPGGRPAEEQVDAPVAQPNELAQELLRGIVVSEILTRPCDRMALQRNRRRA